MEVQPVEGRATKSDVKKAERMQEGRVGEIGFGATINWHSANIWKGQQFKKHHEVLCGQVWPILVLKNMLGETIQRDSIVNEMNQKILPVLNITSNSDKYKGN